jgi:hypothetical protein
VLANIPAETQQRRPPGTAAVRGEEELLGARIRAPSRFSSYNSPGVRKIRQIM